MHTSAVVDSIVRVVSPYLGETMARASARTHCEKLGIQGAEMTGEQLDALVGKLASGLAVFVGREKTSSIVQEIRKATAAQGATA